MHSLTQMIRQSSLLAAAKRISVITLILSLPSILLAQRWDKIAILPIATATFSPSMNGLTTGPEGDLWYTDSSRNVIGKMTTTGTITEYSACCNPEGITTGPDGALWVGMNDGVGRITTTGAFTFTPLSNCCNSVQGITVGPDGALWFTEGGCCYTGRIGRITTAGIMTEFAQLTNANPLGIVAGKDGNLWFTEQSGNRIGRITTAGAIVEFPVPSCCGLEYITAGSDGALWFTEPNANKIGRISLHGAITEYAMPIPNSIPWGITTGPDGAIWFTEQNAARFGRITATPLASGANIFVEYPLPTGYTGPGVIASGPDGNLWFSAPSGTYPSYGESLGKAAACAPDLNLTYANGQLNLGFTLGNSVPFNFGGELIDGAGMKTLWNKSEPAFATPRSFTETIKNVTAPGTVGVLSTVGSSTNGLLCYDLEAINTSGAAVTTNALEQVRRNIVDSGLVKDLPQP